MIFQIKLKHRLTQEYPKALSTKCRSKGIVYQRRAIVLFLLNQGFKKYQIVKLTGLSKRAVMHYSEEIADLSFNAFYKKESKNLKTIVLDLK